MTGWGRAAARIAARVARGAAAVGVAAAVARCTPPAPAPASPAPGLRSPLVGAIAPDFTAPALDGAAPVHLGALRGAPVVLAFFATDCFPCAQEAPFLVAAARTCGARTRFVGVAAEATAATVRAWLDGHGGRAFPVVIDGGGAIAAAYGVAGAPETVFIAADGRVSEHLRGIPAFERLIAGLGAVR